MRITPIIGAILMVLTGCAQSGPAGTESCTNGVDDDNDKLVDCLDSDCDGQCLEVCDDGRDNDGDGVADCDDPQCAGECPELCDDQIDNDHDQQTDCDDSDCLEFCDADGDGQISEAYGGTDCDDSSPEVFVGADEVCDGLDNDCNGLTDEDDPDLDRTTMTEWHTDNDGDGYGWGVVADRSCMGGTGLIEDGSDCDDQDPLVNPAAQEVCNRVDDDCDGLRDDNDPSVDLTTATTWYLDADGDGFGDPYQSVLACDPPNGYVDNADDCDDSDALLLDASEWVDDLDGDGYGSGTPVGPVSCTAPGPYMAPANLTEDCDDLDPTVYPGAPEVCEDTIDQNCDGYDESCCEAQFDVEFNGICYYLDGSGGTCQPGDILAPQSILVDIAPMFIGKTYKTTTSNNCCVAHADQALEMQDWGMSLDCNAAGIFQEGPIPGGTGCTNVLLNNTQQLTLCQTP